MKKKGEEKLEGEYKGAKWQQKGAKRERHVSVAGSAKEKTQNLGPGVLATKVGYFGSNLLKCC